MRCPVGPSALQSILPARAKVGGRRPSRGGSIYLGTGALADPAACSPRGPLPLSLLSSHPAARAWGPRTVSEEHLWGDQPSQAPSLYSSLGLDFPSTESEQGSEGSRCWVRLQPPCCLGGAAQVRLGTKHRGIPPVSGALTQLSHLCLCSARGMESHPPPIHTGIEMASWALPLPRRPEKGARRHPPCRGRGRLRLRGSEPTAAPSSSPICSKKPWFPLVLSRENGVKKRQCGSALGLSMGRCRERVRPCADQSRCRAGFRPLGGWCVCVRHGRGRVVVSPSLVLVGADTGCWGLMMGCSLSGHSHALSVPQFPWVSNGRFWFPSCDL